jgi:hypothetical protein
MSFTRTTKLVSVAAAVTVRCCKNRWIHGSGVYCPGHGRRGEGLRMFGRDFGEGAVGEEDEGETRRRNLDLTGVGVCVTSYGFDVQVSR